MDHQGQYTREEILSQPEAWAAALEVLHIRRQAIQNLWHQPRYAQVIFTGCGSTYYLALAAATLFQELSGFPARGLPASELWLSPQSSYSRDGRVLLVAVSRSGETTETLRACEAFNTDRRGDLVTLSCYVDMPLAKMGVLNLVFPSGAERSVAQTRAFSTLYLGTLGLAALWAGRPDLFESLDQLPMAGRRLLGVTDALSRRYGQDLGIDRFYFLGSGPRYGLACELSLKMKEMSLSHSEPFHFMEFRHGPKSMMTRSTLVVGLVSETNRLSEMKVLDEMRLMGGQVLAIGEAGADVCFESGLEEALRNVLYLPVGQLLAFERSLSKGLNPDRPNNLDPVVKL